MPAEPALAEVILAALPDLLVVSDASGGVTASSPALKDFLGRRPQPTRLEALAAVLGATPTDIDALSCAIPGRFRVSLRDATGAAVPFRLDVRHHPDGRRVLLARDTRDLRAREEAERGRDSSEQVLAHLGHELRTPLNAVLGFAQLLELETLPADQRDAVDRILIAGRMMQGLLDQVLDLARIRGGGIDLDVGPVPVLEVARGVLDLVAPMADARGIQRRLEPADSLVAVADRARLWQVLLNLVGNAIKYGRDGGTLRVGILDDDAGGVRIEVEDDGPGIAPELLGRLFRPFDRLGAERSGVEGTGLGLALSQALSTAMGGTLSATSHVGAGTVFAVTLLAADSSSTTPDHDGEPPLVLLFSGDTATQALVEQALRTRVGAVVHAVSRASLARDAVRSQQPALVLVDGDLSDGTGIEVLRRLAGDPLTALVPLVALSQDTDPRVTMRLRAAGATQVLALPVDVRLLLDVVRALLPAPAAGSSTG